MATYLEHAYSLVHQDNTADQPTLQELRTQLEKGTDDTKVETMKRVLTIMLNGDSMPLLLMHIIRFVMPSKNKPLKKLLYFYYEICPKLDAAGKLKQEMILVWYSSSKVGLYEVEKLTSDIAMAYETTCNIPMNTLEEILYAFYVNYENPNSLSPYYHLPDHVWNTVTPTYEKTRYTPFPLYTNCPKHLYLMPRSSYSLS